MDEYSQYIETLEAEGKICLKGKYWDKAFGIITESKKRDNSILPNPLILGGWNYSDDEGKLLRFREHLKYAFENGKWNELQQYIASVPDEAWHLGR